MYLFNESFLGGYKSCFTVVLCASGVFLSLCLTYFVLMLGSNPGLSTISCLILCLASPFFASHVFCWFHHWSQSSTILVITTAWVSSNWLSLDSTVNLTELLLALDFLVVFMACLFSSNYS